MIDADDKFPMTGIILAGGKSSRMGQDKALLKFGRKTLLEHLASLAGQLFAETLVIVNEQTKLNGINLGAADIYEDIIQEQGPLGGIYTGLLYSKELVSCVFTCDMPFVNEVLVRELISFWDFAFDAVCYKEPDGNFQPFPGLYRRTNRLLIRSLLDRGENSMYQFLKFADVKLAAYQREEINFFTNVNEINDYIHALKLKNQFGQWV